jgi:hypothetical protein
MNDFGVRVLIKETNELGYITRRLDAHSYEIWLDSGRELVLDPEEFIELKKEQKNE